MEDKGQKLYEMFVSANARRNCEVDSWYDIGDEERELWREMARDIQGGGL